MRTSVKAPATIEGADRWRVGSHFLVEMVHIGCCIKEALGAQKISSPRFPVEGQTQGTHQEVDGMITPGAVVGEIAIATLPAKPVVGCDRLE